MSTFLIHIHTGPADPTKVTLGFAVAAAAAEAGHAVTVFLAGDGVSALAPEHREGLQGKGTGSLAKWLPLLVEKGGQFRVSRLSAEARGHDERLLEGLPAAWGMPADLVTLADAADTVLCY